MAVDAGCGACPRMACSTGHCDQRYTCCDLHGDVGMPKGMHRPVGQPCRITHLMYLAKALRIVNTILQTNSLSSGYFENALVLLCVDRRNKKDAGDASSKW